MPLEYISPAESVNIFANQAPVHSYGAYIPAPTAQARDRDLKHLGRALINRTEGVD
jgi:hypothetical protein